MQQFVNYLKYVFLDDYNYVFFMYLCLTFVYVCIICVDRNYMIANIPLATGNKLNFLISASGMVTIIWHCALVL